MAIIPKVGRKSLKMRLVIALLYTVLTVGAITMVYPFVLMLKCSVSSGADIDDYSVIPAYLISKSALLPKYAEDRYAGDVELINQTYGTDFARIKDITPPNETLSTKTRAMVLDWEAFVNRLPGNYKQVAFEGYEGSPSRLTMAYQVFCRQKFGGDIRRFNAAYGEENISFQKVTPPFERFRLREWEPDNSPKMRDWLQFKATLPAYFLRPILLDSAYQAYLKNVLHNGSIKHLNNCWQTNYHNFTQIHLSSNLPIQPSQRADWTAYVRQQLPFRYMSIKPQAAASYQQFLKSRYSGVASLNAHCGSTHRTFDKISLPKRMPSEGPALTDWMDYIARKLPIECVTVTNTENLYRKHLLNAFGSVTKANAAHGTAFTSIDNITPPVYESDWYRCSTHAGELRKEFATRNYAVVIDYMLVHGRAVMNTLIFVVAVIMAHLIINPLCAYALSRYNLAYSHKVLLFLLATMAFPAEVAMIPSFLLLKQLHLLNTYWALIFPGMANGYAIFLLKGFFDSLPKELYEAGVIDGASEVTMFTRITLPMSKPIFAVIALQAFTGAYSAFLYAMLVCQDSKMWTVMVWIYQLQTTAPHYVTMAALTLAALPTLLVFVFAQNVIMRGIIVPSLK